MRGESLLFFVWLGKTPLFLTFPPQLAEIQRQFKLEQYGVGLTIWKDVQKGKHFFYHLRVNDPGFFLLPSTKYSLLPDQHSTTPDGSLQLVALMNSSKRAKT